jgi:hypothetical protein
MEEGGIPLAPSKSQGVEKGQEAPLAQAFTRESTWAELEL